MTDSGFGILTIVWQVKGRPSEWSFWKSQLTMSNMPNMPNVII